MLPESLRGIPTVEGRAGANVALSSKAALGDTGATLTVGLEPDHDRCSQRPPSSAETGRATVTHPAGNACILLAFKIVDQVAWVDKKIAG